MANTDRMTKLFEDLGCNVEEVDVDISSYMCRADQPSFEAGQVFLFEPTQSPVISPDSPH